MKKRLWFSLAIALLITFTTLGIAQDQKSITSDAAGKFFGQSKTVCGNVISPRNTESCLVKHESR